MFVWRVFGQEVNILGYLFDYLGVLANKAITL